jgi:TetR/AcrR family transcriptional repressor of nem operon
MTRHIANARSALPSRKEETRYRILKAAARLFLQRGVDRVGVDEIMSECGLTHWGFYGHFSNKEALISDAIMVALDTAVEQWKQLARELRE